MLAETEPLGATLSSRFPLDATAVRLLCRSRRIQQAEQDRRAFVEWLVAGTARGISRR